MPQADNERHMLKNMRDIIALNNAAVAHERISQGIQAAVQRHAILWRFCAIDKTRCKRRWVRHKLKRGLKFKRMNCWLRANHHVMRHDWVEHLLATIHLGQIMPESRWKAKRRAM